tara:strand:+ start:2003 stop:3121 length:1119 start_codon:yes stop_codon:yes gene_type:complete
MSSLLDEAIVDAKALREAVLKNAEASLLEAYAPKIKEAVTSLLEQDDLTGDLGLGDLAGPPGGGLGLAPPAKEEIPETGETFSKGEAEPGLDDASVGLAAETYIDSRPDLDDSIEIELTRGELQEMLNDISKDINILEEEMSKDEEVLEDDIEIDEAMLDDLEEAHCGKRDGDDEDDEEVLEDSIEIDEDMIEEIVESLVVDIMPTKSGWAGTPESVMQHNEELAAAMAQSDKYKEERDELLKIGKELQESNQKYKEVNSKMRQAVNVLKTKIEEVNLSNAKLLYTNRVLRKSSLNERQKETIVEALSNAGSVNEAKVIYETLQSTVGSSRKRGPESLSEAVSRPSSMMPRRKVKSESNLVSDRMKLLAGIK